MAFDPFYIARIAQCLAEKLEGQKLIDCFSTSKEELFLVFDEVVKLQFYRGELFFQFPQIDYLPKRNRITQFQSLHGQEVKSIQAVDLDRSFILDFGSQQLVFHMFGRFSQIASYNQNQLDYVFPLNAKEVKFPNLVNRKIPENIEEAKFSHKWLTASELSILNQADSNFSEAWNTLLKRRKVEGVMIVAEERLPRLVQSDDSSSCHEFLSSLDEFSRKYIGQSSFLEQRKQLLQNHHKKLKQSQKKIQKIKGHLEGHKKRTSFKEQADLIMAYMHQIKEGQTEVNLPSFENGEEVTIKLNAQLSPQQNAQRLYYKSKKEHIQLSVLQNELRSLESNLEVLQYTILDIENSTQSSDLKAFIKSSRKESNIERKPYKSIEIEGLELRIGKSAKDNDELLRLYSSPHDLWFHAANVAGSHVIMRLNRDQVVRESQLEKAAAIAAYYSKSRNEELATVIYSYRKFVRKPKKAGPGKVLVQHEKSVLVKPTLTP
ncbi:MAG: DUF814 domain-containing protein [Bacteroidia bacterium]